MRKTRLNLDTLAVESFQTAAASIARGTVRGNQEDANLLAITALCQPTTGPSDYSCNRAKTYYDTCRVECECTGPISAC